MPGASTTETGDAGEYATAAELAVRGWTVDMPRRNQKGIDLYAYHKEQGRTAGVQVKTRLPRSKGFRFDDSLLVPTPTADAWVVLVTLAPAGSRSDFLVLPRQHINAILRTFKDIMSQRGKTWTALYLGAPEFKNYEERWDLMQRLPAEAEWLMSDWVSRDLAG